MLSWSIHLDLLKIVLRLSWFPRRIILHHSEPLHLVEKVPEAVSLPELNEIISPDLNKKEPLIKAVVVPENDCTLDGPVRSMRYRCVEFVQVDTALQIELFTHRSTPSEILKRLCGR